MGVKLLGKIKIHEIAKEVGLTSKEIIERANSLGISVSSHLSALDDKQAKAIKDSFKLLNSDFFFVLQRYELVFNFASF